MTTLSASDRATLQPGDSVLFIDQKEREYIRILHPGSVIALRGGNIPAEQFIGLAEGSLVQVGQGERFRILRPTYARLIPNLPRQSPGDLSQRYWPYPALGRCIPWRPGA